jgi:acetylornithine deacetylase
VVEVDWADVDAAITSGAEDSFAFLARLVAAPSTLGNEAEALDVFAEELSRIGLKVRRQQMPERLSDDERAGVVQPVDAPRFCVAGTTGPKSGPALLLNGHIDVVPADFPDLWSSPPFQPRRAAGRMYGRGVGDMKSGFALGLLALRALLETAPETITGPLTFLGVIEEECTGNGTLGAALQGILADAVVLLEPTDLEIVIGGVGVLWCDIELTGGAGHANAAHLAVNPIDMVMRLIDGLRGWSLDLGRRYPDPLMGDSAGLYNLNVGQLSAGDWPSSVPAHALLRLRVGFPRAWTPDRAERELRAAIRSIVEAGDPSIRHAVRLTGFRAPGHLLDPAHPLVRILGEAHQAAHGSPPQTLGLASTTDARTYLEHFNMPALCYGPAASNIHGIDESVDLDTIIAGARTLARFIPAWYAAAEREAP